MLKNAVKMMDDKTLKYIDVNAGSFLVNQNMIILEN